MMNLRFLRRRSGQATTEVVLLFPLFVIFAIFIIKIFGLLVLNQKMEIAAFYAARRFQLQSGEADAMQTWNKRFLEKDIKKKVEDHLGFNNAGMRTFLSLNRFNLEIITSGTWTKVVLTAYTKPPRIRFLCNYDKFAVCKNDERCFRGYEYLCDTGGAIKVEKWAGKNDRVIPYIQPD